MILYFTLLVALAKCSASELKNQDSSSLEFKLRENALTNIYRTFANCCIVREKDTSLFVEDSHLTHQETPKQISLISKRARFSRLFTCCRRRKEIQIVHTKVGEEKGTMKFEVIFRDQNSFDSLESFEKFVEEQDKQLLGFTICDTKMEWADKCTRTEISRNLGWTIAKVRKDTKREGNLITSRVVTHIHTKPNIKAILEAKEEMEVDLSVGKTVVKVWTLQKVVTGFVPQILADKEYVAELKARFNARGEVKSIGF